MDRIYKNDEKETVQNGLLCARLQSASRGSEKCLVARGSGACTQDERGERGNNGDDPTHVVILLR
jgi:hypothetical protein